MRKKHPQKEHQMGPGNQLEEDMDDLFMSTPDDTEPAEEQREEPAEEQGEEQ